MAENYFDEDDDAPKMGGDGMAKDKGTDDEEGGDKKTAVINSEICPGMEPGDVMELRIEEVHDKEYVVSYEPKEKEEKGGKGMASEPSESGGGESEYASMLE